MPEKKVVVSDLDGTIVTGSNEVIWEAFRTATAQVALGKRDLVGILRDVVDWIVEGRWGVDRQETFSEIFKDQPPEKIKVASDIYDAYLREHLPNRLIEVDGCIKMFQGLKAGGMVLGLTTATPRHIVTEVIFPELNVPDGLFKHLEAAGSLAEEGGRPKPDPYTITKILEAESVEPAQAIMVGDAQVDVEAGQRAGVDVVVVLTGNLNRKQAEDLGVKPEYIIDNISFLKGVLAQMGRQAA